MSVQKINAINPAISNISWYKGNAGSLTPKIEPPSGTIYGNPCRPVTINADANAGAVRGLGVYYLA